MEPTPTGHKFKPIFDYDSCPVRHFVIEEKKEVWFVGSFATAMGLQQIMAKYFPADYTGCLAEYEHWVELKEKNER